MWDAGVVSYGIDAGPLGLGRRSLGLECVRAHPASGQYAGVVGAGKLGVPAFWGDSLDSSHMGWGHREVDLVPA